MKTFFNRKDVYLLIIFIPTAIYILSNSLFEINAESSSDIKNLIIAAIIKHPKTFTSEVMEYQRRILWIGCSLLLIITYLSALFWSVYIIRCCYSRVHIIKLAIVGLPILTLALIQIMDAESHSTAMYNSIFHTTYLALQKSPLTYKLPIRNVYFIIATINILAVITPIFIMFAICSSISMPPESGAQKLEFFIKRMNYLKQCIMLGSTVLLFGIIHMFAWMQWPIAMIGEGEEVLKNGILNLVSSTCQFWGITATLALLFFYASAAIYWQARTQDALTAMQPHFNIPKWMEENGITVSLKKDALQIGGMLSPAIISALSHLISMD